MELLGNFYKVFYWEYNEINAIVDANGLGIKTIQNNIMKALLAYKICRRIS